MRYKRRITARNDEQMYDQVFKTKGVKGIRQYVTPNTPRPTREEINKIRYYEYVWTVGDRFWSLADKIYGDKNLWYVIARFNNTPTEADVESGQIIRIPKNAQEAKRILGI